MPETNWGRKETIIWPPHKPIYTFGAVFFAVVLTAVSPTSWSAYARSRQGFHSGKRNP
jgi:hypothetical protein